MYSGQRPCSYRDASRADFAAACAFALGPALVRFSGVLLDAGAGAGTLNRDVAGARSRRAPLVVEHGSTLAALRQHGAAVRQCCSVVLLKQGNEHNKACTNYSSTYTCTVVNLKTPATLSST